MKIYEQMRPDGLKEMMATAETGSMEKRRKHLEAIETARKINERSAEAALGLQRFIAEARVGHISPEKFNQEILTHLNLLRWAVGVTALIDKDFRKEHAHSSIKKPDFTGAEELDRLEAGDFKMNLDSSTSAGFNAYDWEMMERYLALVAKFLDNKYIDFRT